MPTLLFDDATTNTEYQFQLSRYTGNSNCSYPTTEGIKDIDKKILFFPDILFQGISIMDNDDLINPALNNGKTFYRSLGRKPRRFIFVDECRNNKFNILQINNMY